MKKKIIIPVLIILLAAVGALTYLYLNQKQEMVEMVEQMEFEKSELEDEYEDLAMQFDGYRTPDIHNDSVGGTPYHQGYQRAPYSRTQEGAGYRPLGDGVIRSPDRLAQPDQPASHG